MCFGISLQRVSLVIFGCKDKRRTQPGYFALKFQNQMNSKWRLLISMNYVLLTFVDQGNGSYHEKENVKLVIQSSFRPTKRKITDIKKPVNKRQCPYSGPFICLFFLSFSNVCHFANSSET